MRNIRTLENEIQIHLFTTNIYVLLQRSRIMDWLIKCYRQSHGHCNITAAMIRSGGFTYYLSQRIVYGHTYMDQADDSLESLELRAKESRTLIS